MNIKKVPVLFIIFNRLETTEKVISKIKQYKPDKLYIASDGPRKSVPGEREIVNKTRNYVLESIDWECSIKTLFRDSNIGCGRGPSEAISWLFENEEMGIILEDDCVPSLPFFNYCEYLLNKYQSENRIWVISGRSHYENQYYFKEQDYIFSNYVITWGWATWKRCWSKFNININSYWNEFYVAGGFKNVFLSAPEGIFRNLYYKRLLKDKKLAEHVWDYQFFLNMNQNGGLAIIPAKNLVENIGYEGTHFTGTTTLHKIKAVMDFKIKKEPKFILPNRQYEKSYFYHDLHLRFFSFFTNRFLRLKQHLKNLN